MMIRVVLARSIRVAAHNAYIHTVAQIQRLTVMCSEIPMRRSVLDMDALSESPVAPLQHFTLQSCLLLQGSSYLCC